MPSADTFDCPPIEGFVKKYLAKSKVSIDPFARNKRWATYTNDLNLETAADYHMDAGDFCEWVESWVLAKPLDLGIFDPPYSPRQITECYRAIGKEATMENTQNGALYSRVRKSLAKLIPENGIVLSFGWNSAGMGKGWEILEIMLVAHGGAHNDTICMAERKLPTEASLFDKPSHP